MKALFVSLVTVAALTLFAGGVRAGDCRVVQRVQVQRVVQKFEKVQVKEVKQVQRVEKVVEYVPAQIVTERVVERFYTVPSAPTVEIRRFGFGR